MVIDIDLVGWIIVGFFAGALSAAVVREDRSARGCLPNLLIGVLGGLLGGLLAKQLNITDHVSTWISAFVVAFVGAVIIRWLLSLGSRR